MDLRFVLFKNGCFEVADTMTLGRHTELGYLGWNLVFPLVGQGILTLLRVVWYIICSVIFRYCYAVTLRDANGWNWLGCGDVGVPFRLATSRRMAVQMRQGMAVLLATLPRHNKLTLTFSVQKPLSRAETVLHGKLCLPENISGLMYTSTLAVKSETTRKRKLPLYRKRRC
jgi:hypothetical protein